jgi:hypothetical protein
MLHKRPYVLAQREMERRQLCTRCLCDQSSRSSSQGEYLLRLVLMCRYVGLGFGQLTRCFRSHRSLLLENLALRQQLAVAEAQASPTPDRSG